MRTKQQGKMFVFYDYNHEKYIVEEHEKMNTLDVKGDTGLWAVDAGLISCLCY